MEVKLDAESLSYLGKIEKGIGDMTRQHGEMLKQQTDLIKKVDEAALLAKTTSERLQTLEGSIKSRAVSLPGVTEDKDGKKFEFRKAILLASEPGLWNHADFAVEREVLTQTAKKADRSVDVRDMATGSDALGGFLVPVQYVQPFIDLFRARLIAEPLGATVMPGLTGGPVIMTKLTGDGVAYWVAEGNAPTASDLALGQVTLSPKELAAITYISNRLLRMSAPNAETLVRNSLSKVAARAVDLALMQGPGGLQPLGIVNTPGVNTTSMGATPDVDKLYDMQYEVEVDNADEGSLGWGMSPRSFHALRKQKDAEGNYILTPDNTRNLVGVQRVAGRGGDLLGFPFRTSTQIPNTLGAGAASRILFGNWADLVIGMWGGLEIMASKEAGNAFANNQTYVRLVMELDGALLHGESFCVDSTVAA